MLPPRGRWIKYAVGAMLAYGICVLAGGGMLSNEFLVIVQLGLIMGLFLFLVLGPIHFLLQYLAFLIVLCFCRPGQMVQIIFLNLPALGILVWMLVGLACPPSPARLRKALQEHFNHPLPASVNVKDFNMGRGLNEGSYKFVFSISTNDLEEFLSNSGCILNTSKLSEAEWIFTQSKAKQLSKDAANINPPWSVYISETNLGKARWSKTILVGSNLTDVLFFESFF